MSACPYPRAEVARALPFGRLLRHFVGHRISPILRTAVVGFACAVSACRDADSISGVAEITAAQAYTAASAVRTIEVSPDSARLDVGDTLRLHAKARDRRGRLVRVRASDFAWTSSNSSIATVNSRGLVTAVGSGSAIVTATRGEASGSSRIAVGSVTAGSPGTVTDLRAAAVTDSSVTLKWTQVGDGAGGVADYDLRYGTPTIEWAEARPTAVTVQGTTAGSTREYTWHNLVAGTSYEFELISFRGTLNVDAVFGGFSNVVSTTLPSSTSPLPSAGSVFLFHSNWSTATGTSDAALRDNGKALPWTDTKASGGGTQIVTTGSTGMTWPTGMANVMRIMNLAGGSPMQGVRLSNAFAPPLVGQSVYYRVYVSNTTPNSYTGDDSLHPWQDGNGGGIDSNWRFRIESETNGTWRPELYIDGADAQLGTGAQIQTWVLGRASGGKGSIRLNKGTVYGFEVQVERVSLTRWEPHVRVLDVAGNVIYDDAGWYRGNGNGDTLAEGHPFALHDATSLAAMQLGSNGWSADPAQTYQAFVWGGMAICLNEWCGPYRNGR